MKIIKLENAPQSYLDRQEVFINEAKIFFEELESIFIGSQRKPEHLWKNAEDQWLSNHWDKEARQLSINAHINRIAQHCGIEGQWLRYPPLITSITIRDVKYKNEFN